MTKNHERNKLAQQDAKLLRHETESDGVETSRQT